MRRGWPITGSWPELLWEFLYDSRRDRFLAHRAA
jgi:hypothetical protein